MMMTGAVRYSKKVELWRNQPSALTSVHNESKKIQKGFKKPVIIHLVPPKIIHVEASEFKALVQQLTGFASSPPPPPPPHTNDISLDSFGEDRDAGSCRIFPVKVKPRILEPRGRRSMLPSVFCNDPESQACEGELMESESWFKWGDY